MRCIFRFLLRVIYVGDEGVRAQTAATMGKQQGFVQRRNGARRRKAPLTLVAFPVARLGAANR